MSKFTSMEIGFHGDHAAVTLQLKKPIITMSSKPKDEDQRETFEVITTTQTFNKATLPDAIKSAAADKDHETYFMLLKADDKLREFIAVHGATNPHEEADWEHYQPYGEHALAMA